MVEHILGMSALLGDNKNGPRFHPPKTTIHHDNHYQDEADDDQSPGPSNDPTSDCEPNEDDDKEENPYEDVYNIESSTLPSKEPELVPMTFAEAKQGNKTFHFSKVLSDSGGTRSSIARSSIPVDCRIHSKDKPFSAVTAAGTMDHYEFVHIDQLFLPEFCRSRWIDDVEFVVFEDNSHSAYNAILGRDI